MAVTAGFPPGPVVDASGEMTQPWRLFFLALYQRTGAGAGVDASGLATTGALAAETEARASGDVALTAALSAEASARAAADAAAVSSIAASNVLANPTAGTAAPKATAIAQGLVVNSGSALAAPYYTAELTWIAGQNPNKVPVWVAPVACRVVSAVGRVEILQGGASAIQPVIVASGTSISAGATLTTGPLNCNTLALTNQTLTLIAAPTLAAGACIGVTTSGTMTTTQGCLVFTIVPT